MTQTEYNELQRKIKATVITENGPSDIDLVISTIETELRCRLDRRLVNAVKTLRAIDTAIVLKAFYEALRGHYDGTDSSIPAVIYNTVKYARYQANGSPYDDDLRYICGILRNRYGNIDYGYEFRRLREAVKCPDDIIRLKALAMNCRTYDDWSQGI